MSYAVRLNDGTTIGVDADSYVINDELDNSQMVIEFDKKGDRVATFVNPVFVVLQDTTPTTPIQENPIVEAAPNADKE